MGRGRQGTTDRRNIRKLQIVLKLVMHIFITYLSIYILISITNDMSFRRKKEEKKLIAFVVFVWTFLKLVYKR